MRLTCGVCGRVVSTEILDNTVVVAFIQCPECIELEYIKKEEIFNRL